MSPDQEWIARTLAVTRARAVTRTQTVQRLWSGYGQIVRAWLDDGRQVVVKHVQPPHDGEHPRGWNTDRSHQRKLHSYAVEVAWYREHARRCDVRCRVPALLGVGNSEPPEVFIVLEDLDAAGFAGRRNHASKSEVAACLGWLAEFHATFLGRVPKGLWNVGTYWHLDTRPDELEALPAGPLKDAAAALDARLNDARFQTFVHGDAKLANFCFGDDAQVAAVDFQYVGGGCGMKDVAYFVSSVFYEADAERHEDWVLDTYFAALRSALSSRDTTYKKGLDVDALEHEWRGLYAVAWTDFYRFLMGWSPGHPKIHGYSERLAREVLTTC